MSENPSQRAFSKLRFIPATYMVFVVVTTVLLFVGLGRADFRDASESITFLPLFMGNAVAQLANPPTFDESDLEELAQRTGTRSMQIQNTYLRYRSAHSKQGVGYGIVFCWIFLVAAIGTSLKSLWALRLAQIVFASAALLSLIAYFTTPKAFFDAHLISPWGHVLAVTLSVTMLLLLIVKDRKKA